MDLLKSKAPTSVINRWSSSQMIEKQLQPVNISSGGGINTTVTLLTALPGIAALILVLYRTSTKVVSSLPTSGWGTTSTDALYTSQTVGIGTVPNPSSKLHVKGNTILQGKAVVGANASSNNMLFVVGDVNDYTQSIYGTGTGSKGLLIEIANDTNPLLPVLTARSNNENLMNLYSDGTLMIGSHETDSNIDLYGPVLIDTSANTGLEVVVSHNDDNRYIFQMTGESGPDDSKTLLMTSSGKMLLGETSIVTNLSISSLGYSLQVFGDVNFVGNVYQNGEILSGGDGAGNNLVVVSEYLPNLTVGGFLTVENEIRSNNFLTVVRDGQIGGNLTVLQSSSVTGNLNVGGRGTFTDIFVEKDIFFNGNIYQKNEPFGVASSGTTTGVTKYSDVNSYIIEANDVDWYSPDVLFQEGRTITTSRMGSYMSKDFLIVREGTYILNVTYLLGPDFGYVTASIDNISLTVNSKDFETFINLYSPWGSSAQTQVISYTVSLTAGNHTFKLSNSSSNTSVLKDPRSAGFRVGVGDCSLVYIPVAKAPTQVETRISIDNLAYDDTGIYSWETINSRSIIKQNGLVLSSGGRRDGFRRRFAITTEGSYMMTFVFPLDPSYGFCQIEIEGPSGTESVNFPIDRLDLYTQIGGAGSSRMNKTYSKTFTSGVYELRIFNDGIRNPNSVGYTIGVGDVSMILINAGLSSFGSVLFSSLSGDVIESDQTGWIGVNRDDSDNGSVSRYTYQSGFKNYNYDGSTLPRFWNRSTRFLTVKVLNSDLIPAHRILTKTDPIQSTNTTIVSFVDVPTGRLYVRRLEVSDTGTYEWSFLKDRRFSVDLEIDVPQDYVATTADAGVLDLSYSTDYVTMSARRFARRLRSTEVMEGRKILDPIQRIVEEEMIYVAYVQQRDILSNVEQSNINSASALDSKVRVKRFVKGIPGTINSTDRWVFVSSFENSPSISSGPASHLTIEIDETGAPILAYSNLDNPIRSLNGRMVVLRYKFDDIDHFHTDTQFMKGQWEYIINEDRILSEETKLGVTENIVTGLSIQTGGFLTGYVYGKNDLEMHCDETSLWIAHENGNGVYDLTAWYRRTDITSGLRAAVYFYRGKFVTNSQIPYQSSWDAYRIGTYAEIPNAIRTLKVPQILYVAFTDGSQRVTIDNNAVSRLTSVYKYSKNEFSNRHIWGYLGPPLSRGSGDLNTLRVFRINVGNTNENNMKDMIYVAFRDNYFTENGLTTDASQISSGSLSVKIYNPNFDVAGSTTIDGWTFVGSEGFSIGSVNSVSFEGVYHEEISTMHLLVAFRDGRPQQIGNISKVDYASVMYNPHLVKDLSNVSAWDYITPSAGKVQGRQFSEGAVSNLAIGIRSFLYRNGIFDPDLYVFYRQSDPLIFHGSYITTMKQFSDAPSDYISGTIQDLQVSYDATLGWKIGNQYYKTISDSSVNGLTLYKGVTYRFTILNPLIPNDFKIVTNDDEYGIEFEYTTGIIQVEDNTFLWIIPETAPDNLYFVSRSDSTARGFIQLRDDTTNLYGKTILSSISFDSSVGYIIAGKSFLQTTTNIDYNSVPEPSDITIDDTRFLQISRGSTYNFILNNLINNPIRFQKTPGPYDPVQEYDEGIIIEGSRTNGMITWVVSSDTPSYIYFVSETDPLYQGAFQIVDVLPGLIPSRGIEFDYFFPYTTSYRITVEYVLGKEFGISRLRINNIVVGNNVDCFLADENPKKWTKEVDYNVTLFGGLNTLRLENVGLKNENAIGFNLGVSKIRVDYFSTTRNGDMDNLTVTGSSNLNKAFVTSLSVSTLSGLEEIAIGTATNSRINLGNGRDSSGNPLGRISQDTVSQDIHLTNYLLAGGFQFDLTNLQNLSASLPSLTQQTIYNSTFSVDRNAIMLRFDSNLSDLYGNDRLWTSVGSPTFSSSVKKYGGASINLDGATQYIRSISNLPLFPITYVLSISATSSTTLSMATDVIINSTVILTVTTGKSFVNGNRLTVRSDIFPDVLFVISVVTYNSSTGEMSGIVQSKTANSGTYNTWSVKSASVNSLLQDTDDISLTRWTFEIWFYPTQFSSGLSYSTLVDTRSFNDFIGMVISIDAAGYVRIHAGNSSHNWNILDATTDNTVSLNTWNHLAVTFSGTIYNAFLNGVYDSNVISQTSERIGACNRITIGSSVVQTDFFRGFIDDIILVPEILYSNPVVTRSGMILNRYGRLGVGIDVNPQNTMTYATDSSVVAFAVKDNLKRFLVSLQNEDFEGSGLYIKTNSTLRNTYPLLIETAVTDRRMIVTGDSFLGVGVNSVSDMTRTLTVNGNAQVGGGYIELGKDGIREATVELANGRGFISQVDNDMTIKSIGNMILQMNGENKISIDSNSLRAPSHKFYFKNSIRAWMNFDINQIVGSTGMTNTSFQSHDNIQFVTRIRTGVFSVRMIVPMNDLRYCVVSTANSTQDGNLVVAFSILSKSTFTLTIRDTGTGNLTNPSYLSCLVMGN